MAQLIPTTAAPIDAGPFASWLAAQRLGGSGDVPCGSCTACCEAGYFIHVTPDDKDAVAHIPAALLFPAPGKPGHFVMGFNEQGQCPMLVAGRCSIYPHRPQTCRDYDCRVFAATGIAAGATDQERVNQRAARWQFQGDAASQAELRRLGAWLMEQTDAPANGTEAALVCLSIYAQLVPSGDFSNAAKRAAFETALQTKP